MSDFYQAGLVTTLHDFGTVQRDRLESLLVQATRSRKLGLILPVTASDMRAAPFAEIVRQLRDATYIDTALIVLGMAPERADYRQSVEFARQIGSSAHVLWTDGPRVQALYGELADAGFRLSAPGKGLAVWTAFGFLLADPRLTAFVLHDCDIVSYDRVMLARLCLPMVHGGYDFEFCKAYYARVTDRMHGRVVRLLVLPLLDALLSFIGDEPFLAFLRSFRSPLAGVFAITAILARSNRIPSDWGLEVGTLAEVFRNTSVKRVCQVDLCRPYEHKHQALSLGDDSKGLMKMARDILTTIFRTLASRGVVMDAGHFVTLRAAYLRVAQDAIRKYHADSLINDLDYDRHTEEQAVEGFAAVVTAAGEDFRGDPSGAEAIANWVRVMTAIPDFPQRLREAAQSDAEEMAA